jgi:hypothetical protein
VFMARVQGVLTVDRPPASTGGDLDVVTRLRELFVSDDAATDEVKVVGVDHTTGRLTVGLDTAGDVSDEYIQRLTEMTERLTGEITVVDDLAHATKHVFRDGVLTSFEGRIVYADEKMVTAEQVRDVVSAAADDVNDAAELPDTGSIDAINLVVNAALHRLFDDPDASLEEVVDACYGIDDDDIEQGQTALDVVLWWIGS